MKYVDCVHDVPIKWQGVNLHVDFHFFFDVAEFIATVSRALNGVLLTQVAHVYENIRKYLIVHPTLS